MFQAAWLAIALCFALSGYGFAQVRTTDLTVEVSGLRNYKGAVVLQLWADTVETAKFPDAIKVQFRDENKNSLIPCNFEKASVCRRNIDSIQNLTMAYTFKDVPVGDYAVFVYHDENSNGAYDKGLFGRALEARGYSQVLPDDVNLFTDKIPYRVARFTLAEPKVVTIGIRYPPRW